VIGALRGDTEREGKVKEELHRPREDAMGEAKKVIRAMKEHRVTPGKGVM